MGVEELFRHVMSHIVVERALVDTDSDSRQIVIYAQFVNAFNKLKIDAEHAVIAVNSDKACHLDSPRYRL